MTFFGFIAIAVSPFIIIGVYSIIRAHQDPTYLERIRDEYEERKREKAKRKKPSYPTREQFEKFYRTHDRRYLYKRH